MQNNKTKGNKGELIATKYLRDKNYIILKNNYRCKYGEIDIIAMDSECLVFVEVKYRTNEKFGSPLDAVNKRKQDKIRMVANYYLIDNNIKTNVRIDVIGILDDCNLKINHIINAF